VAAARDFEKNVGHYSHAARVEAPVLLRELKPFSFAAVMSALKLRPPKTGEIILRDFSWLGRKKERFLSAQPDPSQERRVRKNRAAPFGMTGGEVAEKAEEGAGGKGEERRRKVRRGGSLPGLNAGLKPGGYNSELGSTDTPVGWCYD
jgi:hypothetical protein